VCLCNLFWLVKGWRKRDHDLTTIHQAAI
jgi:hypothetical protein